MSNVVSINPKILEERIDTSGKSRKAICLEMGVSGITLRRWLNGTVTQVRRDNLEKISDVLKCDPEDLIDKGDLTLSSDQQSNAIEELDGCGFYQTFIRDGWQVGTTVVKTMFRPDLTRKMKTQLYFWAGIYNGLEGKRNESIRFAKKLSALSKGGEKELPEKALLWAAITSREFNSNCEQQLLNALAVQEGHLKTVAAYYFLQEWYFYTGNLRKTKDFVFKGIAFIEKFPSPLRKVYLSSFYMVLVQTNLVEGNTSAAGLHLDLARKALANTEWSWGKIALSVYEVMYAASVSKNDLSRQIMECVSKIPKNGLTGALIGDCIWSAGAQNNLSLATKIYEYYSPGEDISLNCYVDFHYLSVLGMQQQNEFHKEKLNSVISQYLNVNPDMANNYMLKKLLAYRSDFEPDAVEESSQFDRCD